MAADTRIATDEPGPGRLMKGVSIVIAAHKPGDPDQKKQHARGQRQQSNVAETYEW